MWNRKKALLNLTCTPEEPIQTRGGEDAVGNFKHVSIVIIL